MSSYFTVGVPVPPKTNLLNLFETRYEDGYEYLIAIFFYIRMVKTIYFTFQTNNFYSIAMKKGTVMVSSGITENCSFSRCPRSGHNTMYLLKTTMMLYLIFILGHCPHESWVQCTSENIGNIRSESLANLFFICQIFFF